jgi:diguanylate cyclase (GGDEF)-like protein
MNTPHSFKEKILIIADHDQAAASDLGKQLSTQGFKDIRQAEDGSKIYQILRPFYSTPEQIGLVIINEDLPQCQVKEICQALACADEGSVVPFIILSKEAPRLERYCDPDSCQYQDACLIHVLPKTVSANELQLVVNYLLAMKHERFLRHKQEERLINELAERKVVDSKLKYLVVHDELTGLYNRNNFERQLRMILNRGKEINQNGVLIFLDIDRFSVINELEGFEVGDRLLVELVVLIRKIVFSNKLFARIGSDEFCLFLDNQPEEQALTFAEKIRKAVEDYRFFTGEVCYSITISIGLSLLNSGNYIYHPSELILRARQACNTAKSNGRNMVWLFNDHDVAVKERRRDIYWVPMIKKALLERELFLVFQPVVQLSNGRITHYEALIRMRGENNVIISPNHFIPAAERMGLIHSIDLWVVETAIEFLAALPPEKEYISLAINLSSCAFQDTSLLPAIRDKLELSWINPTRLTFEITETAAIENYEKARYMIEQIRAIGCQFALDDFGAGFCSFNYLKSFPVDFVKIDGQFIQNLMDDETDQVLVKSMADIVRKLGKKTIAEFVETPSTISKLKEFGIDYGQGYIFGKPETEMIPSGSISIEALLQEHSLLTNSIPSK